MLWKSSRQRAADTPPVHVPELALDHARSAALQLSAVLREHDSYVLGLTSAVPGEGKSTVSSALADVLAADFAHHVVLLDLHAERPSLPVDAALRISRPGISDWARNECTLDEVLIKYNGWAGVACGTRVPTSRDLLHMMTRYNVLSRLRERFNVVLVDLPDLGNSAGAALASLCDGVVLVARAGATPAHTIKAALAPLHAVTLHGVVLNRHRSATPGIIRRMWA